MKMKIEDTNKVKQRQKTPGVRYSWGGEGKQHGKKNANNSKKGVKKWWYMLFIVYIYIYICF